jgi:hypothetical protein
MNSYGHSSAILTSAIDRGQLHTPAALISEKVPTVLIAEELKGAHCWPERYEKREKNLLPLPGIESRLPNP